MRNGVTHENLGFPVQNLSKEKLNKIREVYICPSFACNLRCPHCTLKNINNGKLELPAIINSIKYIKEMAGKDLTFELFGGEPLLLQKDVISAIYQEIKDYPYYVSTNLLPFEFEKHIEILKGASWVNSSWNPKRFDSPNGDDYDLWRKNMLALQDLGIKVNLMITLTSDLVYDYTPQEFIELIRQWNPFSIDLDYVIGEDNTSLERIDDWILDLYNNWNLDTILDPADNIRVVLLNPTLNRHYRDCWNHYTILPTGNIKPCCPYYECDVDKTPCYCCELFYICNGGCRLESKCTFPKKLFYKIKEELNA